MKSSLFNLRLNTASNGDDETIGDKLFQTRAAATGNARSPIVECFIRGMTSAAVFADRRRSENHHLRLDRVQQRGTVVQYRVDSRKQALPDGKLFSSELVNNFWDI